MISSRLAAIAAAVAATSLILAGCGNNSSSGTGGTGSGATSSAPASSSSGGSAPSSSLQDEAKTKVAEYEQVAPTYPGPTTPIDPGTGKAAVLIAGQLAPILAENGQVAVDALKAMGWDVGQPVDGQFSPQVQGAFMDRAVQQGLDAVILVAPDVNTFAAQTEAAAAAGITIICVQCLSGDKWKGKVYDVTADFYQQGVIAAWKQIADKGDHAKVIAFADKQFGSSVAKATGDVETLDKECPDCKADLTYFTAADASKPGPPSFTAAMASHPVGSIDYVQAHYDGLATAITKTMQNAGRTDFLIGGYDGDPGALKIMAANNPPFAFDVAEPFSYECWVAADLAARIKLGQPLYDGYDKMPSTLIDSTNVDHYISNPFPGPPNYQANFKQLWGKS